eukprot:357050-Chlamydomonas_euryale.AAC.4
MSPGVCRSGGAAGLAQSSHARLGAAGRGGTCRPAAPQPRNLRLCVPKPCWGEESPVDGQPLQSTADPASQS